MEKTELNCRLDDKDSIINRILHNTVYRPGSTLRENVATGLRRMSLSNLNGLEIILGFSHHKEALRIQLKAAQRTAEDRLARLNELAKAEQVKEDGIVADLRKAGYK